MLAPLSVYLLSPCLSHICSPAYFLVSLPTFSLSALGLSPCLSHYLPPFFLPVCSRSVLMPFSLSVWSPSSCLPHIYLQCLSPCLSPFFLPAFSMSAKMLVSMSVFFLSLWLPHACQSACLLVSILQWPCMSSYLFSYSVLLFYLCLPLSISVTLSCHFPFLTLARPLLPSCLFPCQSPVFFIPDCLSVPNVSFPPLSQTISCLFPMPFSLLYPWIFHVSFQCQSPFFIPEYPMIFANASHSSLSVTFPCLHT